VKDEMNQKMTIELVGGIPHPDPRHLGSRVHGKAKIIEYSNHKIVMVVKPHYVEYVREYIYEYFKPYQVEVSGIVVEETDVYEHQSVYEVKKELSHFNFPTCSVCCNVVERVTLIKMSKRHKRAEKACDTCRDNMINNQGWVLV
jgi:hypothetical protein